MKVKEKDIDRLRNELSRMTIDMMGLKISYCELFSKALRENQELITKREFEIYDEIKFQCKAVSAIIFNKEVDWV